MTPTIITVERPTPPVVRVVRCPHCDGMRMAIGGVHSPHWQDGRLVDCKGKEVHR